MNTCFEGQYLNFNVGLWQLYQLEPQDGGLTADQWIDMQELKFIRQANQSEYSRIVLAMSHLYPACPKCSTHNHNTAVACGTCRMKLRDPVSSNN